MSHSIDIDYPHLKDAERPDDPEVACTETITINLEYEPPDYSVGIWGGFIPDEPPEKCATCGHLYTEEERREMEGLIMKATENYDPEPDPEPDWDPMEDYN